MPGKILCLDIGEDLVTAVMVKSGLNRYEVIACAQAGIQEGEALEEAFRRLFEQIGSRCDTCLLSIPGHRALYRNLHLPFRDTKKIRQVLPFEMEAMVPFPIEDLVVDFALFEGRDGSGLLAASVKKSLISEYLSLLQVHGMDPERIDIRGVPTLSSIIRLEEAPSDGLLLDVGEKVITMLLYANKSLALIRHFPLDEPIPVSDTHVDRDRSLKVGEKTIESEMERLIHSVQTTIHAFKWQEKRNFRPQKTFLTGALVNYPEVVEIVEKLLSMPVERVDFRKDGRVRLNGTIADAWKAGSMDHALALALRDERHCPWFNFRAGEFATQRKYEGLRRELRAVLMLMAVLLAFLVVDFGVDYHLLKKRYTLLDQNIRHIFQTTFPDVKRIVDPLQQMKVKIREMRKAALMMPGASAGEKVVDILREISKVVPKTMDVHVTRMVIDPETVEMSGDTDTFKTVDNLKGKLEPLAYFSSVTISSANVDRKSKRVRFVLKLKRRNRTPENPPRSPFKKEGG